MRIGRSMLDVIDEEKKRQDRKRIRGVDAEAILRDLLDIPFIDRRGNELWCSCPLPFGLHISGDGSPSFSVNTERLVANCFVCGGGDLLWLVESALDITSEQALKLLKRFAAPEEPESKAKNVLAMIAEERDHEHRQVTWDRQLLSQAVIPHYSPSIIEPWQCVHPYFTDRGVTPEVQERMRLGFDPRNRDEIKTNVWVSQERVVIPHFFRGKLVGWQKRKISSDQQGMKYKSSPRFPKYRSLYNYDGKDHDLGVVVESPLSTLRRMSDDFDRCVGTFGSSLPVEQVKLLASYKRVVLFFDADPAGRKATERVATILRRVVRHPDVFYVWPEGDDGRDPADMDMTEFERLVDSAESVVGGVG